MVLESNYVETRLDTEVSWCWCLRMLGAEWLNDLQVMMISTQVNWWAVIGWVGEPAVLCQYIAYIETR